MHLALNFQRVDPARGGAETYVADLCRYLVGAGHRVDLYAESWAEGCLPARGQCGAGQGDGANQVGADRQLRQEFRRSPAASPPRLLGRLHQHLCSRRDHPPGGRSTREPDGQRPALFVAARAADLRARQDRQSQALAAPLDREQAVRPVSLPAGRRGQQHGQAASRRVPSHSAPADPRGPQRHRSQAARGVAAGRGPLRLPQPVRAGARRPDRSVCRPQLRAQGPEAADGGPGRPPEPKSERPAQFTCWSAAVASPALFAAWRAGSD